MSELGNISSALHLYEMNLQAPTMTVHMPMVTSSVRLVFPAYSK